MSAVDREERSLVDLAQVVERAVHWVKKGTAPAFEVQFSAAPGCTVSGSPGQLLQVMMNLVQNAYDAAAAAPLAAQRPPRLQITMVCDGPMVRLAFRDNGPGVSDEHLSRLFDPFFTTKPVGKGTGLGLSISYGIVERHGGQLGVANSPLGGAEFSLSLPLAPPATV